MALKRGDLVTVALQGDYGKPRPALIVQSDLFDEHPSVTILPVTSELRETPLFRIRVVPNSGNGLQKSSDIMVDKVQSVPRERIGEAFGHISAEQLLGNRLDPLAICHASSAADANEGAGFPLRRSAMIFAR